MAARASSRIGSVTVTDGIIQWFDGPEWDEVAEQEYKTAADQIEALAKSRAPWQDRTGEARRRLNTSVENDDNVVTLTLAHGVDYGYWLEVIQNGRFAIIMPTLEAEGRRVTYNAIRRIRYARRGKEV